MSNGDGPLSGTDCAPSPTRICVVGGTARDLEQVAAAGELLVIDLAACEPRGQHLEADLTEEMGKITAEAEAEVEHSAEILDYFADHATQFLADETLQVKDAGEARSQSCTNP